MTRSAELESIAASLARLVDLLRLDSRCKWRPLFERCLTTADQYREAGLTQAQATALAQAVISVYDGKGSFQDYSPTRFDPYTGRHSRIPGAEGFDEIARQVFADALALRPVLTLSQAFDTALARYNGKNFYSLSDTDQLLVTIWGLEAEVNNGGFNQYYFNPAGDQARHAPAALRRIGAHAMASLVERANAFFGPEGPPENYTSRQDALESIIGDAWDEIDVAFYRYPDNIAQLLAQHLGITDVA